MSSERPSPVPDDQGDIPQVDPLLVEERPEPMPQPPTASRPPRRWARRLIPILLVLMVFAFVLGAGIKGIYDGMKDRAIANRQIAQKHYGLGLEYLDFGDYELAVAELELALRYDPGLPNLDAYLREAKELAQAQVTPTSQTRQSAAALLYHQAIPYYEGGNLMQAIAILNELRDIDPDYQRENVETMLSNAHYQLGLNAVGEDRLDDAAARFETVMVLNPNDKQAEEQLNLLTLYRAALSHWEQDWPATIQALKGLHTLAPDYKDVAARLHNAHTFLAEDYADKGDWCQAATEYASAAEVFPLESTVDRRDDAQIRCQATTEAPKPTLTLSATTRPTPRPTLPPQRTRTPTPTPSGMITPTGLGKIAYTSYDADHDLHDLYLFDLTRSEAILLQENACQPAFSPDGQFVAFHNHHPDHLGVGLLDLATREVHDVSGHPEDAQPAWAPDAGQIAFASNKHGDRRWRIYGISAGDFRGEGELWTFGWMPSWAPDGRRVAYHGCDERGDNCGLWTMQPGGGAPLQLTENAADTTPRWSPDGEHVAFTSTRNGNWDLFLVDVMTGQVQQLTGEPSADVAPAWSPDGQQLAFLSNRGDAWAVWILDPDTGSASKLVETGDPYPEAPSETLSWTP